MIYYFQPYDTRGLGYAYNSHCKLVPNADDWICLFDSDTMFFSSQHIQEVLESVVARFHPQFAAFTCVTNRAYKRSRQQLQMGIREQRDLVVLKSRADWQFNHRVNRVEELTTSINGHFLFFPKSLWQQVPFSPVGVDSRGRHHHIMGVDTEWHRQLRANGLKMGLIHQLMLVHFYRMDDPQESGRNLTP